MRWVGGWAWRVGGALGIIWLVGVALLAPPGPLSSSSDPHLSQRLHRAVQELDSLKKQNDDIRQVLQDFTLQVKSLSNDGVVAADTAKANSNPAVVAELQQKLEHAQRMLQQADVTAERKSGSSDFTPSLDFELTRRQVERGVQELWWYMTDQMHQLRKKVEAYSDVTAQIDQMLEEGQDHVRVAQFDMQRLSKLDGLGTWREQEAADLSNLIQKRLHALQNPPDCSKAKKLVCNLNKGCGYGCQIHHVVYCFVVAYGTKRTLILKSKGWRYNKAGWEDVFQPLSDSCTTPSGVTHSHWPGTNDTQVLDLPIIDTLSQRPPYLPLAIPRDLSERLMRLHGDPAAWWVGQFLKYLLKPQPKTQEMLDNLADTLGFQKPIVGIHVRRTDKVGTEAAFHSIDEYMMHVERYYSILKLTQPEVTKRVYLASDDPTVITEAQKKFPDYTFIGDSNIARTAAVATRYTDASLKGIIADVHFLSLTDYLVCTFSSQVCRIAYEIMQTYNPDASSYFRSLDDIYYYGGQNAHNQKARFPHNPRKSEELALLPGDIVGIAGNHWDGYSKGVNRRTRQNGLYPSYKMEEVVDIAEFPSYTENQKDGAT
ncbi:alpha-(1,6)-fucosyltransferase-like isoform X2 [Eriocheir sinensis]|uniref:alpha-(1,6)-fucosyltransferase-like isoform X2 n=1 Tax=Eriocheir sinensis TaxID=95602 RepID=UPI0021C5C095|nr:alpha-(1,6)-fucosyltransferase-like isoform X2 [Eriocheir sinensis]